MLSYADKLQHTSCALKNLKYFPACQSQDKFTYTAQNPCRVDFITATSSFTKQIIPVKGFTSHQLLYLLFNFSFGLFYLSSHSVFVLHNLPMHSSVASFVSSLPPSLCGLYGSFARSGFSVLLSFMVCR